MLYERWRQIARAHPDEIALRDLSSNRHWTFRELASAVESDVDEGGGIAFPQGISAEFIVAVLQAWRADRVVCPLETGQAPPEFSRALPSGIVHLKATSATGGDARLVAFTEAQLAADAANIVATMGLRPD